MSGQDEYAPTIEQFRHMEAIALEAHYSHQAVEGRLSRFDRMIEQVRREAAAEQREKDAQIARDAAATWVDEWQPNSHKNSHVEDYIAAAIREAGTDG